SLNESEVYDMISVEWDWNEAKKIWLEEGEEKGFMEGMAKGIAKGKSQGRTELYKELLAAGLLTIQQLKEIGKLSDEEIKSLQ
ncbi:MAG: hypothetical protein ACI3ZR_08585, partial [bacterium]